MVVGGETIYESHTLWRCYWNAIETHCSKYHISRNYNKHFLNLCFFHTEQKRKAKTDKLQDEIDKLKEQLQLTKSQLEAEQQANMVRFSKVICTK